MRSGTVTCTLLTSRDTAFNFIADVGNLLLWAPAFADAIRLEGDCWIAQKANTQFEVRISADARTGTIDFEKLRDGEVFAISPSRLLHNGRDAEYVFTFFQTEGMPDDVFHSTLEAMADEFLTLKRLLDRGPLSTAERSGVGEAVATIRSCTDADSDSIWSIINDGAEAYRGVIPPDCWHEPYMTKAQLEADICAGVHFWCAENNGVLAGVMGVQPVLDAVLIRHAYVRTAERGHGLGSALLAQLLSSTRQPVLIGAWRDATWAIAFYEKHGFREVTPDIKDKLLRRYWTVPDRQIETSVVLAKPGQLPPWCSQT